MLIRTYQCDLCGNQIANLEPTTPRWSRRIRFCADGIDLCDMTDPAASEKVLCGKCLTDLAKALGVTKE